MTLLDLSEPLFQYISRLHRAARKGLSPEVGQVRADIKGIFAQMRSAAAATPGGVLEQQYERIEIILFYFVDFMIRESRLNFARAWKELAHERNMLAGDEDFFDELDKTLAEPDSDAVRQRLAVFYVCLGLGFTGWYTGNTEHLRRKMNEIASRIRGVMDADRSARVCPEAYEHVNTANLVEPPARGLVGIAILLIGVALAVFAADIVFYRGNRQVLRDALRVVEVQADTGDPSAASAGTEGR